MNMLGNTLQLIAGEKAGIIKPGIPVIIGEQQPEVSNVFIDKAAQTNSNIRFASEEWTISSPEAGKSESRKEKEGLLKIIAKRNPLSRTSSGLSDFRTFGLDLTGS